MPDILIVALVTLAAHLLAVLTTARRVPIFRIFLFVWIARMLFRVVRYSSEPLFDGTVLALKVVVTFEAVRLICTELSPKEAAWLMLSALGFVVAGATAIGEAGQQAGLLAPTLVFAKHFIQLSLAIFLLAVNAYVWKYYPDDMRIFQFERSHAWLLCVYWWTYAIAGMIVPTTMRDWVKFTTMFYVVAIPTSALWISVASDAARVRQLSRPAPRFDASDPQADR